MEHARYSNSQESTSSQESSPFSEDSGPDNSGYGNTDEVSVGHMGGQYQPYAAYPIGGSFPGNKLYSLIEGLGRLPSWTVNPQDLAICLRSARQVFRESRYVTGWHGVCVSVMSSIIFLVML
jgi:hypothetical protein